MLEKSRIAALFFITLVLVACGGSSEVKTPEPAYVPSLAPSDVTNASDLAETDESANVVNEAMPTLPIEIGQMTVTPNVSLPAM
jgi:hypothetical protein